MYNIYIILIKSKKSINNKNRKYRTQKKHNRNLEASISGLILHLNIVIELNKIAERVLII